MACAGADPTCLEPCTDLSGVALDPPNVLENVDATVGLTGAGAAFVNFVAIGDECCVGATSVGPTHGGQVSSDGQMLTPINLPAGYYKACIKLGTAFPFSDDEYTALATPLQVTVTPPPPPPPPPSPPLPSLPPPPAPPPHSPPCGPPTTPPAIPPLFGLEAEDARCIVEMGDMCITFDSLVTIVIVGVLLIFVCAVAKPLIRCITKNRITPGCAAPHTPNPPTPTPTPTHAHTYTHPRTPTPRHPLPLSPAPPPARLSLHASVLPEPILTHRRRRGHMVRVLTHPAWSRRAIAGMIAGLQTLSSNKADEGGSSGGGGGEPLSGKVIKWVKAHKKIAAAIGSVVFLALVGLIVLVILLTGAPAAEECGSGEASSGDACPPLQEESSGSGSGPSLQLLNNTNTSEAQVVSR